MTTIHYMQGISVLIITENTNVVPRIGDKVKIYGQTVKVKDVIWHLDDQTWVEVQIDF